MTGLLLLCVAGLITMLPVVVCAQEMRAGSARGVVTIVSPEQAVTAALTGSPVLRGAWASYQATRADTLQAPLRPNPEASIMVENFGGIGGRGRYRGGGTAETTVGVSQRIELGGKRMARIALAGRGGDVATLIYDVARLDLMRDVVTALAEAEAAARNMGVEQERLRLATETLRVARMRVEAGKEPLLQTRRAEVVRAGAEIAAERARREAEAVLHNLSVLLGVSRVELAPRRAWFDDVGPPPPPPLPADPLERLAANPDLARLDAIIVRQRANISLQRANGVPDVTLQGYVRRFEEGRDTAFMVGASIPLPLQDRNQAGIARARAELSRAETEAEHGWLALVAALVTAERRTELAWRAVQSLRRDALPAAEQAARFAAAGFAEGKFGFLDVLDAQRALSDTRAQLNDALREFHVRRASVKRLRGQEFGVPPAEGSR